MRRKFFKWLKKMYKKDNRDKHDYYIITDKIELPKYIDLSKYTPITKKETEIKSCLINVVLEAMETMINILICDENPNRKRKKYRHLDTYIKNNNHNLFSESNLFDLIFSLYGDNLTYRTVLKTLNKNIITVQNNNGQQLFKIYEYAKIANTGSHFIGGKNIKKSIIYDIKLILSKGIPLIGSIKIPFNVSQKYTENSGILIPTKDTNFNYGVLFVGYNDNMHNGKGYFTFKNSWGKKWGEKGYGYISYDDLINKKCLDFWVITSLSINNKIVKIFEDDFIVNKDGIAYSVDNIKPALQH